MTRMDYSGATVFSGVRGLGILVDMNAKMKKRSRGLFVVLCCVCAAIFSSLPRAAADDLDSLKLPVYRDRAGYGLGVMGYSLETEADFMDDDATEHALELTALLQPPDDEDVLCFSSALLVQSAEDERGRDMLRPQRRNAKAKEFRALVPSLEYSGRRGKPLLLCEAELDTVELERSGTAVKELVLLATAVLVKERETEEIDAEVADQFVDVGHGTSVQVSSIEVDRDGEMNVKLNVKHTGNRDLPVIDSVYALDGRGRAMGGGRWSNDLELFGKRYEVELAFPLTGDEKSIAQFQIVLATEYEIEEIEFTLEDLFED